MDTRLSDDQVRSVADDEMGLRTPYQPDKESGNTATTVEYDHTSQSMRYR
jgi:hypothetical protein